MSGVCVLVRVAVAVCVQQMGPLYFLCGYLTLTGMYVCEYPAHGPT